MFIYKGENVIFSDGVVSPATIFVNEDGQITDITKTYTAGEDCSDGDTVVVDAGSLYIMPGVIDPHVHVNEPGRTEWEGYSTATQAAAAGGITTIIDMPLNSSPCTVSTDSFNVKLNSARGICHVDVGFWGGVVPSNECELRPMLKKGVCGFKCFMVHSGLAEFESVQESDIHLALKQLQGTSAVLLFHAEVDSAGLPDGAGKGDPREYKTFLETRPDSWEISAIETVCRLCEEYGVNCHIVHLATAEALGVIQKAKKSGAPITVETTHHYLTLAAEEIKDGATQFKCCPPVRSKENQEALWSGVKSGLIDMVVSDHSPCTPDLKHLDDGDFLKAWGGVASLQFGLSLFWTGCKKHGLGFSHLTKNLCESPAKLCGVSDHKGRIEIGMDADFTVWDPNDTVTFTENNIYHKNKITPYMNREFDGKVWKTFVRGKMVYDDGKFASTPQGKLILSTKMM